MSSATLTKPSTPTTPSVPNTRKPFAWLEQSLTLAWRNIVRIRQNPEALADVGCVFMHAENENFCLRAILTDETSRLHAVQIGHGNIEDRDVRFKADRELSRFPSAGGFSHNDDVRLLDLLRGF